jgi:ribose transport system permease protein
MQSETRSAPFFCRVSIRAVSLICFTISGACAAAGGVLLAGWANRSYQAMGDPYLLPTIAAIVLGGTNVLGGRGGYLGTVAGVILITLLQSILSVLQPQIFFREFSLKVPAGLPPDLRHRYHQRITVRPEQLCAVRRRLGRWPVVT